MNNKFNLINGQTGEIFIHNTSIKNCHLKAAELILDSIDPYSLLIQRLEDDRRIKVRFELHTGPLLWLVQHVMELKAISKGKAINCYVKNDLGIFSGIEYAEFDKVSQYVDVNGMNFYQMAFLIKYQMAVIEYDNVVYFFVRKTPNELAV